MLGCTMRAPVTGTHAIEFGKGVPLPRMGKETPRVGCLFESNSSNDPSKQYLLASALSRTER